MENFQINTWASGFGKEYTDRNIYDTSELDKFYEETWGVTRTEMNRRFLGELDLQEKKILEVGCNVGNQLRLLQATGYQNLYGIELQSYAVEKAKSLTSEINIIKGVGDDIPYKDEYFDVIFTSGVLIHINPKQIEKVIREIYRCSKQYIWGFEYYADEYTEINYRGNNELLWKNNFAQLYLDIFPNLTIVKKEKYKYVANNNVDEMYILKKNL